MPTLHIYSNVPPDETSFSDFTSKATELLSKVLEKNTSYIQVIYTRSMVRFGDSSGPSALVELTSIELQQKQIEALVEPLSKLLQRTLSIIPPTTYIHFFDLSRKRCVWNGRMLSTK